MTFPTKKCKSVLNEPDRTLNGAMQCIPQVVIYSNSDLANPYQLVEAYENGQVTIQEATTAQG